MNKYSNLVCLFLFLYDCCCCNIIFGLFFSLALTNIYVVWVPVWTTKINDQRNFFRFPFSSYCCKCSFLIIRQSTFYVLFLGRCTYSVHCFECFFLGKQAQWKSGLNFKVNKNKMIGYAWCTFTMKHNVIQFIDFILFFLHFCV